MRRERRHLVLALMVIMLLAGLLKAAPAAAEANGGWLSGWSNRIQLTIDHASVSSTLSDFPLLVQLSSSSGVNQTDVSAIFTNLGSDYNRDKIAVTTEDGTTELYVEIEKWDTASKQAWLWVKVPAVSARTNTLLYLYYDALHDHNRAMVGDTGSIPAQRAWDTSFVTVHHLEQRVNPHPGVFRDSTSRHHDGTGDNSASATVPRPTPSVIGEGQAFDNSAGITIPDDDDFSVTTTGELTISLWVSEAVPNFKTGGFVNFMGKGDVNQYEWSFVFYQRDWTDRSQRISFYIDNPEGGLGSGSYVQEPLDIDEWVHITGKIDSQYIYIYRNGVLAARNFYKGPDAFADINPRKGSAPVRIGTRDFGTWFEGRIDEVRISSVSRSDAWIAVSYLSESDHLISMGLPENDTPYLSPIADTSASATELLTFEVSAVNRSGRPLRYSASNLPPGASFDFASGTFSWTPDADQVGTYPDIRFQASDGVLIASENVTITVVSTPEELEPSEARPSAEPSEVPTTEDVQPGNGRLVLFILVGAGIIITIVASIIVLRRRLLRHAPLTKQER